VKCRSCSAEIDAKAIVCYRCGTPTADLASVRPPAATPASRTILWVVVAVVVAAITVYLVYFRPV
jgi:hypothetical protein